MAARAKSSLPLIQNVSSITKATSSFGSMTLYLSDPVEKSLILFVILYRPPGPYNKFLADFFEFLCEMEVTFDKFIIVGLEYLCPH